MAAQGGGAAEKAAEALRGVVNAAGGAVRFIVGAPARPRRGFYASDHEAESSDEDSRSCVSESDATSRSSVVRRFRVFVSSAFWFGCAVADARPAAAGVLPPCEPWLGAERQPGAPAPPVRAPARHAAVEPRALRRQSERRCPRERILRLRAAAVHGQRRGR